MKTDAEPVALSALQHWAYCPRQCGLIHLEQVFEDNVHTARGQAVHRLVDEPGYEVQSGVKIERSLPLWSDRLGLVGEADLVELKHSRKRRKLHDDLQLAAQAMCLEEMLGRPVPNGAIYHASSHRRRDVAVTSELRRLVEEALAEIRAMLASGRLPPPVNDGRCRECSLKEVCQPEAICGKGRQEVLRARLFSPEDEA